MKGETAEGFFLSQERSSGLTQNMRQTVTVVDPVKNKCHECVPIMGVHSWLFALKKRRLLRKRSDRFVTGHLIFRKKEGGNR